MSDTEETKVAKRSATETTTQSDEDDSNDEWIGPMPTEAVPTKKRKGIKSVLYIQAA